MFNLKGSLPGALLMAPLPFTGCYPRTPDHIEEHDLVHTDHSATFDFQAATT